MSERFLVLRHSLALHATTLPAPVIIAGNTTPPSVTSDPCIDMVTDP